MDDLSGGIGFPLFFGVSLDAVVSLIGVFVDINKFHMVVSVSHFEKAVTALRPFLPEFPDIIHDHFVRNFPVVSVLVIAIGGKMSGKRRGVSLLARFQVSYGGLTQASIRLQTGRIDGVYPGGFLTPGFFSQFLFQSIYALVSGRLLCLEEFVL